MSLALLLVLLALCALLKWHKSQAAAAPAAAVDAAWWLDESAPGHAHALLPARDSSDDTDTDDSAPAARRASARRASRRLSARAPRVRMQYLGERIVSDMHSFGSDSTASPESSEEECSAASGDVAASAAAERCPFCGHPTSLAERHESTPHALRCAACHVVLFGDCIYCHRVGRLRQKFCRKCHKLLIGFLPTVTVRDEADCAICLARMRYARARRWRR